MGDTHKPRHIRDIAHLYISSSKGESQAPCATVLTVGHDKRCFPGLHTANLAAAISAKGTSVILFERSGLLPNTGFFMSLPPHRYIRWEEDPEAPIAGLGGVKIDCSPKGFPTFEDGSRHARIEFIHLPPLLPERRFRAVFGDVRDFVKPITILLILELDETSLGEVPERVMTDLEPSATCVLYLSDTARVRGRDDPGVFDLGNLADWEGSLRDRVPAVIRAPDSALSHAYTSVCESLLFKINQLRRKSGAARAFGNSPGIRSG